MHKANPNTDSSEPPVPDEHIQDSAAGTKRAIRTEVMNITPELARTWLERNRQNRRVRPDRVERYGELMKDGEWIVSPDAIAFDYNGRLINGQHRLKAIVNSGESAVCIVALNLPPEAFKIADVGVKRTGGDVLRIEGFKNPEELAAVSRLIALWSQGRLEECNQYENVENTTIVDVANACSPDLPDLVQWTNKHKTMGASTGEECRGP